MSPAHRDTQWATIAHALRHSWRWPANDDDLAELANRVSAWNTLDDLVGAVEYFQRSQPDRRPSANELHAEAARRRRAAQLRRQRGVPPPCPQCPGDGWVAGMTETVGEGQRRRQYPALRPCPTCRPGTAAMHRAGHYAVDAPIDERYADDGRRAAGSNAGVRYGPPERGPVVGRPPGVSP